MDWQRLLLILRLNKEGLLNQLEQSRLLLLQWNSVTFAKFAHHFFFIVAMKIFVTLAIFLVFADFVKAFLAFSHTKTRILLNLLVLLFLPYSLLSLLL